MAPRKNKQRKPVKEWSMYPDHHADVSRLLEEADLALPFHNVDDETTCIKDYDTSIMGRFICRNGNCAKSGWSSKLVPITIRLYRDAAGEKYNARVYHQRCKRCNALSRPIVDGSYAERIAYRLKKWNGIEMKPPASSGESKGPHNSLLCAGCKYGHCSRLERDEFSMAMSRLALS